MHNKPPTGLNFGGYVHRNLTGTASGLAHLGNTANSPMSRNASYAQQMLRLRPDKNLHLDVLGLPNVGTVYQPTVPRERPQTQYPQSRRHSVAQSDSQVVEALRTSTRGSIRGHQRAKTVDDRLLASKTREDSTAGLGGMTKNPRKLEPLPKRPPSSSVTTRDLSASHKLYGTLPPIEGEAAQTETESQKVERPISGIEEDLEASSESSSESEDEVRTRYYIVGQHEVSRLKRGPHFSVSFKRGTTVI